MSPLHGGISHVSDTALLVAACRALEAECADGFVHDPFAARLAGERGKAMFQALPHPDVMRFGIAVRSHFMDELLLETLRTGTIDTVLSVGCGLDTRPWRLELPAELRWMEVDFADMLDYKEAALADEKPRCRRERFTADLTDVEQRRAVFAHAGQAPTFMITEGLLMYLPGATVEAIATQAWRDSAVTHWMSDIATTAFNQAINPNSLSTVRHVQADDSIPGEQILETIRRQGWVTEARRSYLTDMEFAMPRIRRMFGDRPRPERPPVAPDDPTGVHRFARG
jgi:methyltransferase (TIGR00027 family)